MLEGKTQVSQIIIDNLKIGMQLAENVQLPNGRLLLHSGITLSPKHLLILRTWGVATVKTVNLAKQMSEAA